MPTLSSPLLVVTANLLQDSVEISENEGSATLTIQRIGLSQVDIPLVLSVEEQSAKGVYCTRHNIIMQYSCHDLANLLY